MKKIVVFLISIIFSTLLFAEKPIVQDLQAIGGAGTKINLIWNNPKSTDQKITKFLVYRDTQPITDYKTVSNMKPIAELDAYWSSYTDTVNDFKDYFYAIIAVTDKPYDIILPSINATNIGAHLVYKNVDKEVPEVKQKEQLYPEGNLREKPLPYIDYIEGLEPEELISSETLEAAKKLSSKSVSSKERLTPYYFEEDLISPDGGDDYLLFDVLKTYFVQKKYEQAVVMLEKLAGTNLKSATRNRTYFYMGEAYYFLGEYSDAVRIFVRIEKEYPILTKKWIDSSLDYLSN